MVSSSLRHTCILGNASTAVANFMLVWYFRDRFRPRDSPDQKPCHYLGNVAKALSLVARISVDGNVLLFGVGVKRVAGGIYDPALWGRRF